MDRKPYKAVVSAVLFMLLVASTGAWSYVRDKQPKVLEAANYEQKELTARIHTLGELANLAGGGALRTRIQLQGSFGSEADKWERELEAWSSAAGITAPLKAVHERGREVYRVMYTIAELEAAVLLFREDNEARAYYVVTLSDTAPEGVRMATEEAERMHNALIEAGYEIEWNATVQGDISAGLEDTWSAAEKAVTEWGKAVPLDRYEDDHTISVSYETDYMGKGVEMKNTYANLQVALYEDVSRGIIRISIGTPLITGEY